MIATVGHPPIWAEVVQNVLEIFGLDQAQETVYLTLLDHPSATLDWLYLHHSAMDPARIDEALNTLEEAGLVAGRHQSPVRYVAAPPDVALLGWLRHRTNALQEAHAVLGTLVNRYQDVPRHADPASVVDIAYGRQALTQWEKGVRAARHEICVFERPPYGGPTGRMDPAEAEKLESGVKIRLIYDQAAIQSRADLGDIREGIDAGEEARVVGDLPLRMLVVDRERAYLPVERGHLIQDGLLIVQPSALVAALSALFEEVWQRALPLNLEQAPSLDGDHIKLDESLGTIASLLAAGLTDRAIARHLGVSIRTVERHTQRLMASLGAKTRYQAGVLAARHGWT
jgi:sugar-specific transcriptional regulator TrmB